jgi:hypothetical protein
LADRVKEVVAYFEIKYNRLNNENEINAHSRFKHSLNMSIKYQSLRLWVINTHTIITVVDRKLSRFQKLILNLNHWVKNCFNTSFTLTLWNFYLYIYIFYLFFNIYFFMVLMNSKKPKKNIKFKNHLQNINILFILWLT